MDSLPPKPGAYNPTVKRTKLYNSRQIRTQLNDPAFTKQPKGSNVAKQIRQSISSGGMIANKLNIPDYLAARDFEIKALDSAMVKSKTSGASRVFQSLPRTLRRRTASHNVRRIPKRMRKKALREMGFQIKNGESVMLGTKGVTPSGKPLAKKLGRGRQRWDILRKIKILKYAAKWKIKGKLPGSEYISYSDINLRKRLKLLKKELEKLETRENNENDYTPSIKNKVGSHDNTGLNTFSKVSKIVNVKYAVRQRKFRWLPTHIWHAKRAKMIKRWEWNIPNEPTQRCYRSTSRSSRIKGAVAFDTSYMNTFVINNDITNNEELEKYFKRVTKGKLNLKSLKAGLAWDGYVYDYEDSKDPLGKILVVQAGTKILGRVHPSIFTTVFSQLLNWFRETEGVSIHDCKYSLASIEIAGPKALTALQSICFSEKECKSFRNFMNLHKLNDLNTIPNGTVFTFDVQDPRFFTKPSLPSKPNITYDEQLNILVSLKRKPDISDSLLDIERRAMSYNSQLSLTELGQRKAKYPGENIPYKSTDAYISVMVIKSEDKWIFMMPWYWMVPFWHSLMHVPHVNFGGFKQLEQLRLEKGLLGWSDMVFTRDGFIQCEIEREETEKKWRKRPKSKRVEYTKIKVDGRVGELLSPFGLDWRGLQTLRLVVQKLINDGKIDTLTTNRRKFDEKMNLVPQSRNDVEFLVQAIQSAELQLKNKNMHSTLLKYKPITLERSEIEYSSISFNIPQLPPLQVVAIKLSCVNSGNIKANARIFTVPKDNLSIWTEVSSGKVKTLSASNMRVCSMVDPEKYTPQITDLVGLVTSGTFNLTQGKFAGIGYVDADAVKGQELGFFLVRNVSSTSYSLTKWAKIPLH